MHNINTVIRQNPQPELDSGVNTQPSQVALSQATGIAGELFNMTRPQPTIQRTSMTPIVPQWEGASHGRRGTERGIILAPEPDPPDEEDPSMDLEWSADERLKDC